MTVDDSFVSIPLFAVALIALAVLVLFVLINKKGTARISLIHYLCIAIICLSSLAAAFNVRSAGAGKSLLLFACGICCAAILLIPYCLMLLTFEPQKIVKLVPKSANQRAIAAEKQISRLENAAEARANANASTTASAQNSNSYNEKMLDISRDFMVHAADAYSSSDGLSTMLDYINKTIEEQIKADGAAILMIDDFEDVIAVKAFDGDFPPPYKLPDDMPHKPVRVATNFKFASFPLSGNIFGAVATAGKATLIADPEKDNRIYQNGPEDFLACGSYIIVPMKIQDVVIGITAFARKKGNTAFSADDLKIASTLSNFAAATIKSAVAVNDIIEHSKLSKEAEISANIQESLHPAKLPSVHGVQLGTIWNPAEGVCGDFYDVVVSRKDRTSFIIGDIAGKGLNSLVVMIMLRSMMRLVVNTTQTAGTILTWVNKGIAGESFSTDHFGSATLLNYNPELKQVEFATGGNIPVFYYDSEANDIKELSEPSEPIGVEKATEYKDFVQKVKSGDIIITYTDGLVETLNDKGQQYSKESLLRIISEHHNSSSKDIAKFVKDDIKKFSGSVTQHDDETLLLIKIQ